MKAPHWKKCLATSLLAGLLALGCAAARAQDTGKPLLLVASPALQGPYRQTTLVAAPIGERHVGFILNRTTGMKLSTFFPGHAPSAIIRTARESRKTRPSRACRPPTSCSSSRPSGTAPDEAATPGRRTRTR